MPTISNNAGGGGEKQPLPDSPSRPDMPPASRAGRVRRKQCQAQADARPPATPTLSHMLVGPGRGPAPSRGGTRAAGRR